MNSESKIQARIVEWLKIMETCPVKIITCNASGTPDILCCVDGRYVAFEVKTIIGKVSRLQEHRLSEIKRCGGLGFVVRSRDEVIAIIDNLMENKRAYDIA